MKRLALVLVFSLLCLTSRGQQIGLIITTNALKGSDRFVMTFTNASAATNQTYTFQYVDLSNTLYSAFSGSFLTSYLTNVFDANFSVVQGTNVHLNSNLLLTNTTVSLFTNLGASTLEGTVTEDSFTATNASKVNALLSLDSQQTTNTAKFFSAVTVDNIVVTNASKLNGATTTDNLTVTNATKLNAAATIATLTATNLATFQNGITNLTIYRTATNVLNYLVATNILFDCNLYDNAQFVQTNTTFLIFSNIHPFQSGFLDFTTNGSAFNLTWSSTNVLTNATIAVGGRLNTIGWKVSQDGTNVQIWMQTNKWQ